MLRAQPDDGGHFVGGEGIDDKVGKTGGMPGFSVRMVLADGFGSGNAIAEESAEGIDHEDIVKGLRLGA